ncbi:hypothetical protein KUTeg_023644 [Tegillarca granosa]|uniref:Uncharacterized protein n=1 Tax=Tegillarca granosa TaxID=220873 RepID=A0ABQ9E290_TEGGR|nr:hypothetical protein KUTeg_023644 [Tegillarca granosa]
MYTCNLFVFLCVIISHAATNVHGQTCCGPKLFQATILEKVGQYDRKKDKARMESNMVEYYYDYNNKRVASIRNITVIPSKNVTHEHLIADFNKGRLWKIQNKNCTVVKTDNGITYRTSVTQQNCIVVSEALLTNGPVFSLVSNFFQNVTDNVPGNVFDIPDFCPKSLDMLRGSPINDIQLPSILYRHGLKERLNPNCVLSRCFH